MGANKKERDLFSVRPSEEMVKKKKKKKRAIEEETEDDGLAQKKLKSDKQDNTVLFEPLKYNTISEGQVIIGCVSEVRNYEVIISLPGRMKGTVPLTCICKAYTELLRKVTESVEDAEVDAEDEVSTLQELFKVGQYLVTRVSSCESINGRVKVVLSVQPEDVNFGLSVEHLVEGVSVLSCAVTSMEDNGYVVDTGLKNVRAAFIPKSTTKNAGIVGIGSIVRCAVTSVGSSDSGGGVRLSMSADPKSVASIKLGVSDTTNLATLLPGTCIATNIEQVLPEGLTVSLGSFEGVVGPYDLVNVWDQLIQYKAGQAVNARVLYVTPISKVVHLTLTLGVCSKKLKDPLHGYTIGQIIEDAEVYFSSRTGVCLKIGEKCRGFCSGNKLTDKKSAPKTVKSDFPLGSKHKCRIIQYDYMEKFFIVSLQKSVLDQQALNYNDIKVGSKMRATIKGYNDQGAEVAISKAVNAIIPRLHLTDTQMKHPERKYPVGETVTGRVLKVFPEKRQLHLTLKTHLVDSEEIIVDRYSEEFAGKITEGMIVKVNRSGLLLSMYQNVCGFVPKRMTSTETVDDLSSMFTAGSVVKCRVMEVNEQEQKMVLSMVIDGLKPFGKHKEKKIMENKYVHVRDKLNCEVTSKTPEGIVVTVEAEHEMHYIIPTQHLSDVEANCQTIYDFLSVGDKIENALVFRKDATTAILTLKASIIQWLNTTPSEIIESDDYTEGNIYPCVVSEVRQYGALVGIPAGKFGKRLLVHISKLTDQYVSNGFDVGLVSGQSLTVAAKGKDDKDRDVLSSNLRDNVKNIIESSLQLLNNNLQDIDVMREGANKRSGVLHKLSKLHVGQKVSCTVIAVRVNTVVVQVGKKSKGVIGVSFTVDDADNFTVGQVLQAKVLHVDFANQLVIISSKINVVEKLVYSDSSKINVGKTVKCEVLLARKDFIMVMLLSKHSGLVAYLPSQRHINDLMGRYSLFTVGREYKMVVKHIQGPRVLGVLKQHNTAKEYCIFDERPCIKFNSVINEVTNEENNDELNTTQVIAKMERIRFDSQCSNISLEETVNEVVEEEKLREEKEARKLAMLEKDNIPQYDIEAGKQSKKLLQKEKKRKRQEEKQRLWEEKHKKDFLSVKIEEDSGVASGDGDDETDEDEAPSKRLCLETGTGFVWDVPQENYEEHSSSDSEDESKAKQKKSKKKSKLERSEQAKAEERRLVEEEKKRLDASRLPQSALDFEELLQKTPNSSEVWIQFISFHLESAEVDKSKAVARRALEVINVREEEERLNIWTVLLRLEVLYGTEESTEKAYKEALTTNDQLKVHVSMAMIYQENNKTQEAENIYRVMTKKFSQDLDVWLKMGIFYFRANKLKEARTLMDKALLSLEKKIHVELINRFAQLEFKFGESERGRTMFETLLSNYPKRTDIWSVYADLLTKQNDIEGARHVLERMTGLKLRMRKMRFVFKKLMDFEKEHGTPQSVEAVKKRVEEYVMSALHDD